MPESRKARYISELHLSEKDSNYLTSSKALSDIFEKTGKICKNYKAVCNWLNSDIARILNEKEIEPEQLPFTAEQLSELVELIDAGTISSSIGKKSNTKLQLENAKVESQKEFPQEQELKDKQRKLDSINAELKINDDDHEILGDEQEELIRNLDSEELKIKSNEEWIRKFEKNMHIDKLDNIIINELIEDIQVHDNGNINIIFKYQDEFIQAIDFIKTNNCVII